MRALSPKLAWCAKVICGDDDVLTQDRIFDGVNLLVKLDIHKELQLSGIGTDEIRMDGSEVRLNGNPDCSIRLNFESVVAGVPRVVGEIENEKTGHKVRVLINNVGREKALQAAELHGAVAAFPEFAAHVSGLSDFNDLHNKQGLDALREQVSAAVERALQGRTPEQCAKAALGDNVVLKEPQDKKQYVGPVIANTATHSVQDIGKRTAVPHGLSTLNRVPEVGVSAKIVYEDGRGTVVNTRERAGLTNQR